MSGLGNESGAMAAHVEGQPSAMIDPRQQVPGINDNVKAWECVLTTAG